MIHNRAWLLEKYPILGQYPQKNRAICSRYCFKGRIKWGPAPGTPAKTAENVHARARVPVLFGIVAGMWLFGVARYNL
jgi:hypothetical protein